MSFEEPAPAPVGERARTDGSARWEISRRQFVGMVGGGLVAVAGGFGIGAGGWMTADGSLWTVRIVRAGRGTRLTADGLPAFNEAPGPLDFTGHAVRAAATRLADRAGGHPDGHADDHSVGGHSDDHSGGAGSSAGLFPQPVNLTWGDVIVVEVEVVNNALVPILFSPGQLRLRLAGGPTITPQDASRSPEAIAPGAAERLWVSYLAPSSASDVSVEFTDPRLDGPLALALPGLATTGA